MNRERLQILADHLHNLPDERVDMDCEGHGDICGTVACVGGWASYLSDPRRKWGSLRVGQEWLALTDTQSERLFWPEHMRLHEIPKHQAIAAIQSMLDSPDDDALPVWPERAS